LTLHTTNTQTNRTFWFWTLDLHIWILHVHEKLSLVRTSKFTRQIEEKIERMNERSALKFHSTLSITIWIYSEFSCFKFVFFLFIFHFHSQSLWIFDKITMLSTSIYTNWKLFKIHFFHSFSIEAYLIDLFFIFYLFLFFCSQAHLCLPLRKEKLYWSIGDLWDIAERRYFFVLFFFVKKKKKKEKATTAIIILK
jgi:hypothetical protein